jgi:hypothetical protein
MIDFHRFWYELVYAGVQVYFNPDHVVIYQKEQFMVVTEKNIPFRAGYGGSDYVYNWREYSLFDQCLKIGEGCFYPVQNQLPEASSLPIEGYGGVYFGELNTHLGLKQATVYDTEHHAIIVQKEDQNFMVLPKDKERKPFAAGSYYASDFEQFRSVDQLRGHELGHGRIALPSFRRLASSGFLS